MPLDSAVKSAALIPASAVAIASPDLIDLRPGHEIVTPTPFNRDADRASQAASLPARSPQSDFAVLRRARQAGDELPEKWQPRSALDAPQMDNARRAADSLLGTVYAIPTDRELCAESIYLRTEDRNPPETCVPAGEAASRGVVIVMHCTDGTHAERQYLSGLVRDGVTGCGRSSLGPR